MTDAECKFAEDRKYPIFQANSHVISISLTPEQFAALGLAAEKLGIVGATRSEVIRQLLDIGLAHNLGESYTEERVKEKRSRQITGRTGIK